MRNSEKRSERKLRKNLRKIMGKEFEQKFWDAMSTDNDYETDETNVIYDNAAEAILNRPNIWERKYHVVAGIYVTDEQ